MRRSRLLIALGAAAVLALPAAHLSDFIMRIATLTCVYAIASTGWTILGGFANQVSLMQATMFGLGAYTSSLLFGRLHISPWIGALAGAGLAAFVAFIVGSLAFRLRGHYFALATLAIAEMIRLIVEYIQPVTGGSQGVSIPFVANSWALLQFPQAKDYYEIAAVLLLLVLFAARAISRSPLGYRLRALRDDEVAAQLVGINIFSAKMQALVIGAMISALAGTLYAQITGFVDPDSVLSLTLSVQLALYAIVGGAQVWWGPLAGTALLYPLAIGLSGGGSPLVSAVEKVVFGLILVTMVVVQPRGIAGYFDRRRRPVPALQASQAA